jgi:carbonic anhydrase
MTSRMTPLLDRNEQFARDFTPLPLGLPKAAVIVLACLDHRVDPAITLGLQLGDAPVLRNAGGRVTPATVEELAYLAYLGRRLAAGRGLTDPPGVEIAVLQHTQCGTGFLADPDFRRAASEATGVAEDALAATAVADPRTTVVTDVELLLASPLLPPNLTVSGHVYDVDTGRVSTVVPARQKAA